MGNNDSSDISIAFVGDIMPGGVLHKQPSGVSVAVKNFLNEFDIRIGTLECAIGNEPNFDPVKMGLEQDVIYAPDINLQKLKELGISCVSLANNHAFDLGKDGLINTIKQLDAIGIAHCGAGMNIEEASKPAILECKGKKVGFIGLCDNKMNTVGYVPVATDMTPGMNSIGNDYISQIKKLRSLVDYVYIIVHWGQEHTFWPDITMFRFAEICINAGADGIIGGHQHRVQPLITYRRKPIFLGLGNFLFPPRFLRAPRPMYYPEENEDTSEYPITDSYPWVDRPTYKIWKRLGRIGTIGCIRILSDNRQEYTMRIVIMNDQHSVCFPEKNPFKLVERIQLDIVKYTNPDSGFRGTYKMAKFIRRVLISGTYRLGRLIKRVSS